MSCLHILCRKRAVKRLKKEEDANVGGATNRGNCETVSKVMIETPVSLRKLSDWNERSDLRF